MPLFFHAGRTASGPRSRTADLLSCAPTLMGVIRTEKLRAFTAKLEGLRAEQLRRDLAPALRGTVMKLVADEFRKEQDPYGKSWAPLKRERRRNRNARRRGRRGGQKILQWIPLYESHRWIVPPSTPNAQLPGLGIWDSGFDDGEPQARAPVRASRCATIERFCKRCLWLLYKQRD